MGTTKSRIVISIAQTHEEVNQALAFCGSVYERTYGTHWTVPPDLFLVAKEDDQIVATGGLTFASLHTNIASERYFRLTDGMRYFIETNRGRIAEFGRFASTKVLAAKAILHNALSYCSAAGIDFIFAWANPSVSRYTTNRLGLNFWPIAVPLDLDSALSDSRWASPPIGFFQREQPPTLHLGVIPFWENATKALAEECAAAAVVGWQASVTEPVTEEVPMVAMKETSFMQAAPRLLQSNKNRGSEVPKGKAPPSLGPLLEAGTKIEPKQLKGE